MKVQRDVGWLAFLFPVSSEVADSGESVLVTKRGKPLVRIVPLNADAERAASVWELRGRDEAEHGAWTQDFEVFASSKAVQREKGRMVADLDLLIAATAKAHGLVVATTNAKHFNLLDALAVEDWSE